MRGGEEPSHSATVHCVTASPLSKQAPGLRSAALHCMNALFSDLQLIAMCLAIDISTDDVGRGASSLSILILCNAATYRWWQAPA